MNEAITMAGNLCDVLNYGTIVQPDMTEDDDADYRIMVTDTAGNVAEVRFDHELGRWTSEEGFDREAAVFRLARYEGGRARCGVCLNDARSEVDATLNRRWEAR